MSKGQEVTIQELLSGKVRLEFGNEGQLTAIKNYEAKKEAEQKCCDLCGGHGVIEVDCEQCDGTGGIQPKETLTK